MSKQRGSHYYIGWIPASVYRTGQEGRFGCCNHNIYFATVPSTPRAESMSRQKAKKAVKSKAPPKFVAAKNGKPRNGKAGEPSKRAPTPLSTAKSQQYQDFERAIGLLNQRNYRHAKEMFEKAKLGPSLAMSAHA